MDEASQPDPSKLAKMIVDAELPVRIRITKRELEIARNRVRLAEQYLSTVAPTDTLEYQRVVCNTPILRDLALIVAGRVAELERLKTDYEVVSAELEKGADPTRRSLKKRIQMVLDGHRAAIKGDDARDARCYRLLRCLDPPFVQDIVPKSFIAPDNDATEDAGGNRRRR